MDFLTPKEINARFGISVSTIYYRVKNGTYQTDGKGKILLADVSTAIDNPPKKGRHGKI